MQRTKPRQGIRPICVCLHSCSTVSLLCALESPGGQLLFSALACLLPCVQVQLRRRLPCTFPVRFMLGLFPRPDTGAAGGRELGSHSEHRSRPKGKMGNYRCDQLFINRTASCFALLRYAIGSHCSPAYTSFFRPEQHNPRPPLNHRFRQIVEALIIIVTQDQNSVSRIDLVDYSACKAFLIQSYDLKSNQLLP